MTMSTEVSTNRMAKRINFICINKIENGNGLLIHVYRLKMPKTEKRFFIPMLAVADLLSCFFQACFGITENFYFIQFPSELLCKILQYFSWMTSTWSATILLLISFSRYLKICRPTGKQFTRHQKMNAAFGGLLFSVINTLPVLFFVGFRFQNVICFGNNITVAICDLKHLEESEKTLQNIYIPFEIAVIFLIGILTAAFYIPTGLQIFRKYKKSSRIKSKKQPIYVIQEQPAGEMSLTCENKTFDSTSDRTDGISRDLGSEIWTNTVNRSVSAIEGEQTHHAQKEISPSSNITESRNQAGRIRASPEFISRLKCFLSHPKETKENKGFVRSLRKTLSLVKSKKKRKARHNFMNMFITIIIFYFLTYLPTVITILVITDDPFSHWYSMDVGTLNIVLLMVRSMMINHIVNPFIYGYFDRIFRKAFVKSFNKCSFCGESITKEK
ncbi:uncharacterized protein LOC134231794 isoform X2 [Saccostrea cucullata]|uniref:uncharacterized protein LOC134231794 isoform X2 n=1 Tax=Saccostrea cuccullata TaxID=36930 RepID=UPI002ED30916